MAAGFLFEPTSSILGDVMEPGMTTIAGKCAQSFDRMHGRINRETTASLPSSFNSFTKPHLLRNCSPLITEERELDGRRGHHGGPGERNGHAAALWR